MRRYFDARDGRGFRHAMLYPAMQRVVQAAGRVHRTASDDGVIVLLDRRFAQPAYASCFPPHWYDAAPDELVAADPVPVLERFWRRRGFSRELVPATPPPRENGPRRPEDPERSTA